MTNPPKTNVDGYALVLTYSNKADIAKHLGVSKQLLTRWVSVPPQYVMQVSELTKLPISYILPELEQAVSTLLNRPSEKLLPELIKLLS